MTDKRVTEALAQLGLDADDLDPAAVEVVRRHLGPDPAAELRRMLDDAAEGVPVNDRELAALDLPGDVHRMVKNTSYGLVSMYRAGRVEEAQQSADEDGKAILVALADSPASVPDDDGETDPSRLAARVKGDLPHDPDDEEHPLNLAANLPRSHI